MMTPVRTVAGIAMALFAYTSPSVARADQDACVVDDGPSPTLLHDTIPSDGWISLDQEGVIDLVTIRGGDGEIFATAAQFVDAESYARPYLPAQPLAAGSYEVVVEHHQCDRAQQALLPLTVVDVSARPIEEAPVIASLLVERYLDPVEDNIVVEVDLAPIPGEGEDRWVTMEVNFQPDTLAATPWAAEAPGITEWYGTNDAVDEVCVSVRVYDGAGNATTAATECTTEIALIEDDSERCSIGGSPTSSLWVLLAILGLRRRRVGASCAV